MTLSLSSRAAQTGSKLRRIQTASALSEARSRHTPSPKLCFSKIALQDRHYHRRLLVIQPFPQNLSASRRRSMASTRWGKEQKAPSIPRPSSSVLIISPKNEVLLLHRVQTSSSFPSAHVFPGGNLSAQHDGEIPEADSPQRHMDNRAYRLAAIRETFEESGILLARNNGFGRLIEVSEDDRAQGRKAIHNNQVNFETWLAAKGGRADVDGLIPFTRWITPTNVPKRFSTQMYIYFLPLEDSDSSSTVQKDAETSSGASIHAPTSDGGLEHTTAQFKPALKWVQLAQSGEIILFPPQLLLLQLVGRFLATPDGPSTFSRVELGLQRQALREFVRTDDPPWTEKCISPRQLMRTGDGRVVLGLDKPGPELKDSNRRGIMDQVVVVDFRKEGPRHVEVRNKAELLEAERSSESKL